MTQDKIKEVEKEIEILNNYLDDSFGLKEMTKYIKEFRKRTLKSCSEEITNKNNQIGMLIKGQENLEKDKQELADKIEFLIKQYKEEISYKNKLINDLRLLGNSYKKEQTAKVENLKEIIKDKLSEFPEDWEWVHKDIDKIFSQNHEPDKHNEIVTSHGAGSPSGEVCECGHKKSFHEPECIFGEEIIRKGYRTQKQCSCKKFVPKKAGVQGK